MYCISPSNMAAYSAVLFCRRCVELPQGCVVPQTLCGTPPGQGCSADVCGTPIGQSCSADIVWNSYRAVLFCRRCVELLQGCVVLQTLCGTPTGRCCSADVVWNSYRAVLFCRRV